MNAGVNPAVVQGRVEAAWAKGGPHHQGDGYMAGIWFFVVDDPAVLEEGLQLVQWSLTLAIANIGCGYHVVPSEAQARAQVEALRDHLAILPQVLQRFRDLAVLNDGASKSLTAPQGQPIAGLLLEQLFEDEIAPAAPAREAFWRMHTQLMSAGVSRGCEDAVHDLLKFWQGLADARDIADTIMLARFSGADGVAALELDGEHGRVPDGVIKTLAAADAARLRELITEALRDTIVMLRPLHAVLRENPDSRSRKLVHTVLTAALEHKFSVRKPARSALRHLRETATVEREHQPELEAMERYFDQMIQAQLLASYFVRTTPSTLMRALALAQGN